jgi:dopamine beta-monooxygenase
MKGADIILFDSETEKVVDSYVLDENVKPLPDDCQSWTLVKKFIGEEFLIVEVSRKLDTKDTQDRAILPDGEVFQSATRVIAAWGDSATPMFHGPNFAKGVVRFYGSTNTDSLVESFRVAMDLDADGSFFVGASNYSVPAMNETTYEYFCVTYEDLVSQNVLRSQDEKKHIIGFEPVIDPRAAPHVHHFLVFGVTTPAGCQNGATVPDLVYLWAPGGIPTVPPPQVGIPVGGDAGYLSFYIQVHYDNPAFVAGIIDSSGVNVYYTSTVRQYDQGVLSLGDPSVDVQPVVLSVDGGLTQHSFFCPTNCTQNYFQEEVTVYAEALHMHQNGKAMQNQHIRDGVVIRRGLSQYYDFEQQGGYEVVQAPFQVKPGDAFNVVCSFDADRGERWGQASSEEMCISFLFYYPRQLVKFDGETGSINFQPLCGVGLELPGCEVTHQVTPDFTRFEVEDREFGRAGGTCSGKADTRSGEVPPSTVSGTSAPQLYRTGTFALMLALLVL